LRKVYYRGVRPVSDKSMLLSEKRTIFKLGDLSFEIGDRSRVAISNL